MIVGLGTDIVEIVRIGQMIERHGEQFLHRVYTEQEIRYCQRRKECYQHFAGRWAAKEAVMKTLGTGWARGVGWQDIEVCSAKSGQPSINIQGAAREFADLLITPDTRDFGLFNWDRLPELRERGKVAAHAALERLDREHLLFNC